MLLKKTLLANAGFSAVCGAMLLILPTAIANLLGSVPIGLLMVLGGGLLIFAADVYWISRQLPGGKSKSRAQFILWADVAWIVLTPVILAVFASAFTRMGVLIIIDIAIMVALFAWLEWKGLQQLTKQFA